jgi:hypothetical protein
MLALLLAALLAPCARAQTPTVVYIRVCTSASGSQQCSYVPVDSTNPLPVTGPGGYASITTVSGPVVPLGQQRIAAATLATAQSLTVPAGATIANFSPDGTGGTNNNCLRYRDDGTAPTATVGSPLQPGQLLLGYTGQPAGGALTSIQFIEATGGGCDLYIDYYKPA